MSLRRSAGGINVRKSLENFHMLQISKQIVEGPAMNDATANEDKLPTLNRESREITLLSQIVDFAVKNLSSFIDF